MGFIALNVLIGGTAAATDSQPFKASSPWAINYGEQSCALVGNFTDGSQVITLAFERFLPGPDIRLGVAGLDRGFRGAGNVAFRYGPAGDEHRSTFLAIKLVDGRDSIVLRDASLLEVPRSEKDESGNVVLPYADRRSDELSAAAGIDRLTFTKGISGSPEIILGPMKEPIRALQACTDDLMKHLSLDPSKLRMMSRQAKPVEQPQNWWSANNHVAQLVPHGSEGIVSARLIVDERGLVIGCYTDVEVPTALGKATCDLFKEKGRFEPALDAEGKAMSTIYPIDIVFSPR